MITFLHHALYGIADRPARCNHSGIRLGVCGRSGGAQLSVVPGFYLPDAGWTRCFACEAKCFLWLSSLSLSLSIYIYIYISLVSLFQLAAITWPPPNVQISTRTEDFLVDTLALRLHMHVLARAFADPVILKVHPRPYL